MGKTSSSIIVSSSRYEETKTVVSQIAVQIFPA
jgi:hypothetical protein